MCWQAKFVSEVLGRCLRLSYHKRVVEMVPDCYAPLLPAKPEPNFKFQLEGGSGLPGSAQVQALTELLRKKPTPEEVQEFVQQLPNPLKGKVTQRVVGHLTCCLCFSSLRKMRETWSHLTIRWPLKSSSRHSSILAPRASRTLSPDWPSIIPSLRYAS